MSPNNALHLVWDNHLENVSSLFQILYQDNKLVDVTIACRDGLLRAHKLILSACSPYFERIFNENPCKHPVVIIRGVQYQEMQMILEYIYKGYIDIPASSLNNLICVASELEIKGFENFQSNSFDNPSSNGLTEQFTKYNSEVSIGTKRIMTLEEARQATASASNSVTRDTRYRELTSGAQKTNNFEGNFVDCRNFQMQNGNGDEAKPSLKISSTEIKQKEKPLLLPAEDQHWMETDDSLLYDDKSSNESDCDYIPNRPSNDGHVRKSALICTICFYKCKSKKDLLFHQKSHIITGKPHKCEFCPSSFTRSSHLARHRRMHTGERPFICTICGKSFARQDKLKQHIRASHELDNGNLDMGPQAVTAINMNTQDNLLPQISKVESRIDDKDGETLPRQQLARQINNQDILSSNPVFELLLKEKRRRGRPRKRPLPVQTIIGPKRKRGRPRKIPIMTEQIECTPHIKQECSSPKPMDELEIENPLEEPENYPLNEDQAEHITVEPLIDINPDPHDLPINNVIENINIIPSLQSKCKSILLTNDVTIEPIESSCVPKQELISPSIDTNLN